ncbi:DUF4158 domain-containing protein (plasmid) [Lichenicola cladoniae]|uniref:DUF4158 domain-containing protein n=1 Tax=Lichenicola cladoniae TaxID=1484109 RepID=A0A6M8I0N1_9PROT|nr:DUF4158 domain-containing protein [Lichenicola cladoniae]NPD69682.1 DUF4158 domain-containing protein [Acetobacteraceae bacterium]QKE93946.1 DUF4158 domain-containing protein [Lichenicola cladoniae]
MSAIHEGVWDLVPADRLLVEAKRWTNWLRFAVMLLFFRARGRFPRVAAELDGAAVAELARTLGVPEPSIAEPLLPDAADRTAERQRAEIRALFGFREASAADAEALGCATRLLPGLATPSSLPRTPRPGAVRSVSSRPPPTASRASSAR